MKKCILLFCVFLFSVLVSCGDKPKSSNADFEYDAKTELTAQSVRTRLDTMRLPGKPVTEGEQVLKLASAFDPPPILHGQPWIAAGLNSYIIPYTHEPLVDHSPVGGGIYKERLAESWSVSNNTIRITLKPNLKWSDGEPINSTDMEINYLFNADVMSYAKRLEKIDDRTIEIEFLLLSDLVKNRVLRLYMAYDKKQYQKFANIARDIFDNYREPHSTIAYRYQRTSKGDEMNLNLNTEKNAYHPDITTIPVNGPFKVNNVTVDQITFTRNETYYNQDKIYIDKIIGIRETSSESTQIARDSGGYDMEMLGSAVDLALNMAQRYRDTMRIYISPEYAYGIFKYNLFKYPTDNRDFRRAISYLIDSETIAPISEAGFTAPDTHMLGLPKDVVEVYFTDEDLKQYENYNYNPDKAAEILESIGWKKVGAKWQDPEGKEPLITVSTTFAYPGFIVPCEGVVSMLQQFGLNVRLDAKEASAYFSVESVKDSNLNLQIVYTGDGEPYNAFATLLSRHEYWGYPALQPNQKQIYRDEFKGEDFNFTDMVALLLNQNNPTDKKNTVMTISKFMNNSVYGKIVWDKARLTRVFNPKLSLADGRPGPYSPDGDGILTGYYYDPHLPYATSRMIRDGELYFVE